MKNLKKRREFIQTAMLGLLLSPSHAAFSTMGIGGYISAENPNDFLKACRTGDIPSVKKLLGRDVLLISTKDPEGRSGFALALLHGHKALAEYLKEQGYEADLHESALDLDWERFDLLTADISPKIIDAVNGDHPIGGSAMWAAAAGGAGTDIWRVYAKCGDPNVNPQQKKGSTPLQKALRYPDISTAEMTASSLLGNDADPNPYANTDQPPLHIAAEIGSTAIVEMLIRLGAEVSRIDQKGKTAMETAELAGHHDTWKLLKDHHTIARTCRTSRQKYTSDGNLYQPPEISEISLYQRSRFVGASHGNLEFVKNDIERNPNFAHSVATTSEKCVEASAHMGQRAIVELLLDHGAPYSLPTAVMMSDFSTVKKLLEEDPNRIHERGAHDFPLLWYPIIGNCNLDMFQLLLDHNANIEEQHFLGTTVLHWACRRSNVEIVDFLIENGADVNRSGRKFKAEGERPLQMSRDENISALLRSKGAI